LILVAGISMFSFWTCAGFTFHDLLRPRNDIIQLNNKAAHAKSQAPSTEASPMPSNLKLPAQWLTYLGTLGGNTMIHDDPNREPPSPLRGWFAFSICEILAVGTLAVMWRYSKRMVHQVWYDSKQRQVRLALGLQGKDSLVVPASQVQLRKSIVIQKASGNPILLVQPPGKEEKVGYVLDQQGEFMSEGAYLDKLFLRKET
jgi:hypothetical protein